MGKPLGSDGNLWVLLPDNTNLDVTPIVAGVDYYTFVEPMPSEYKLAITANVFTLSNSVATNGANFCVGQNVSFSLAGLPTDGSVIATNFQWTLGGTYVNKWIAPVADGSDTYVNDTNLLKNAVLQTNWWISGGYNPLTYQASVSCDLIFTNGNPKQPFSAQGLFTMHRPRYVTNFVDSINNALTHHHETNQSPGLDVLQVYEGRFSLRIDSHFHGNAFAYITQIWTGSKGNADTNYCFNTQGNYYRDNTEVAGDANDIPPTNNYILVAPDALDNILQFDDGPAISCNGFTWNYSGFKAYVRFEPVGGIPVTIGIISWHCYGDANWVLIPPYDYWPPASVFTGRDKYGSYIVKTGDAKYDAFTSDNTFPSWIHTYWNTNHN